MAWHLFGASASATTMLMPVVTFQEYPDVLVPADMPVSLSNDLTMNLHMFSANVLWLSWLYMLLYGDHMIENNPREQHFEW